MLAGDCIERLAFAAQKRRESRKVEVTKIHESPEAFSWELGVRTGKATTGTTRN
jgi:hypothetical protein